MHLCIFKNGGYYNHIDLKPSNNMTEYDVQRLAIRKVYEQCQRVRVETSC